MEKSDRGQTCAVAEVLPYAILTRRAVLTAVVDAVVHVLLAAVALETGARALAPVAVDRVHAAAAVEARLRQALVHVLTALAARPARHTLTPVAALRVQTGACTIRITGTETTLCARSLGTQVQKQHCVHVH